MNNSTTNKGITKDIAAYAIALGLAFLATALGAWMFLVDILAIAPLVWLGVRRGFIHPVILALLVASSIYFTSYSLSLAVSKGLLLVGISLVLTIGFKANWRSGTIIFWGSLAGMGSPIVNLFSMGPHPITKLQTALTAYLDPMMESYRQAGILQMMQNQGITQDQLKESLLQFLKLLAQLYPSMEMLGVILTVVLSLLFMRYIFSKATAFNRSIPPFRQWTLPWYAIWGAVLGLAAYLGGDYLNIFWLATVGLNVAVCYIPICTVLGIAITAHVFASPKFPLIFKLLFIIFALFNIPATVLVLALLGLFDMVLNFRRIPDSIS